MIKIYGHSDDLVEIEGDIDEEIDCFDAKVYITIGNDQGGLRVVAEYAPENRTVWSFNVEYIDEDVPLSWPVYVRHEHSYSPAIVVDCPTGTPVSWTKKDI